jgi:agmatinase
MSRAYPAAMTFNPDAAAAPGSGVFGLPTAWEEAGIVLIPVPFDATTSYRPGTRNGPAAIRAASAQVDLLDPLMGPVYERGIHMEAEEPRIHTLCENARRAAEPIIAAGGVDPADVSAEERALLAQVNAASEAVGEFVYGRTKAILAAGKFPGVVGGEHSVPFGAIKACAEHAGALGILHIDAHLDFRQAFEGFEWSHASIMHNVLTKITGIETLVSVGIRDFGAGELEMARRESKRVAVWYDHEMGRALLDGERYIAMVRAMIDRLPEKVYVSFDIDGLDPSMCPHTGTPVPGGLTYHQVAILLAELQTSGRKVVGFDLVEVAPGPETEPEWDANVGARVLYKLCGLAGN